MLPILGNNGVNQYSMPITANHFLICRTCRYYSPYEYSDDICEVDSMSIEELLNSGPSRPGPTQWPNVCEWYVSLPPGAVAGSAEYKDKKCIFMEVA
jgi:hypothetical protein